MSYPCGDTQSVSLSFAAYYYFDSFQIDGPERQTVRILALHWSTDSSGKSIVIIRLQGVCLRSTMQMSPVSYVVILCVYVREFTHTWETSHGSPLVIRYTSWAPKNSVNCGSEWNHVEPSFLAKISNGMGDIMFDFQFSATVHYCQTRPLQTVSFGFFRLCTRNEPGSMPNSNDRYPNFITNDFVLSPNTIPVVVKFVRHLSRQTSEIRTPDPPDTLVVDANLVSLGSLTHDSPLLQAPRSRFPVLRLLYPRTVGSSGCWDHPFHYTHSWRMT